MKLFKKIIASIVMLSMVTSFAACGGSEEASESSGETTTITIAVIGDSTETAILDKFKEGFLAKEENQDIKITTVKITSDYESWVLQKMTTKTMPDMIQVYDYSCQYWTEKGLLRSITDLMERDSINASDFSSSVIGMAQSGTDDNYYWLPRDYNKLVVCINTEMFDVAGIEKPSDDWTMTDFYNICQQLKAKEDDIKAVTKQSKFYPAEMGLNAPEVYNSFIKAYGGELFTDNDGTVSVLDDLETVKTGINSLLKYADEGLAFPPDSNALAFINNQAAMTFTSRPSVANYAERLDNNIDFVSMPTIDDRAEGEESYIGMGCTGYGITSSCDEKRVEAAWRFLKYIVSEEGQEIFGESGSGVPVLNSLLEDEDSAWRKFISEDLNHEAFIKYPERDLPAHSYLDAIPTDKKLTIYNTLKVKLLKEIYEEDVNDRDAYYTSNLIPTLERNLEN